jgi:hypothetical protein
MLPSSYYFAMSCKDSWHLNKFQNILQDAIGLLILMVELIIKILDINAKSIPYAL